MATVAHIDVAAVDMPKNRSLDLKATKWNLKNVTGYLGKLEMQKRLGGLCKRALGMDIEIGKEQPRVWPRKF